MQARWSGSADQGGAKWCALISSADSAPRIQIPSQNVLVY